MTDAAMASTDDSCPLISVVTPSYNQAEFIRDNVESVKNQRYDRVEHVVMDGGSTDRTVETLERYEDDYDLKWVSESDEGQSNAINKGFERASGSIVGWLNSDDVYFDLDVLRRVASYFDRFSCDMLYGDIAKIDSKSTVTAVEPKFDFDREKLAYHNPIGQPALFFRDYVLEEKLDEDLDYTMDYEFWMRLSEDMNFQHVRDVLAGFRVHDEQKTSVEDQAVRAEADAIRERHGLKDIDRAGSLTTVAKEAKISLRGINPILSMHRGDFELAFDGSLSSVPRMLYNTSYFGKMSHDPRFQ